jgi:aspartyl-tRNA(Asn)/glutamyl-tRNA(Gln) amidotransferase subunit B
MLEDDSLVSDTIDKILADNPKSIEDYKSGKEKAFTFFVGQAMRALKGKANPQTVNKILKDKLDNM